MSSSQNLTQQNSLPTKQAEFKLKNQKDQASTVRLFLMDQEFIRIQVILSHNCWETNINLCQAMKIHGVFSLNNSIEELFSYIEDSFNGKHVSIETVDSLIYLTFNQVFMNKQILFKITLKQVEINLQQIIQEMSSEFEEKFKKNEEKLLKAEIKISQLEEQIQRLLFNPISKILKEDEKDMIYKWVSAGKEVSHLELLYRASKHGFQAQSYNLRCDGKGPLVCFIQSQNQRRFGGYIHLKFQKDKGWVAANPNNSFLFSLDDKKQYLSNETSCNNAYYSSSGQGFTMGDGHALYLSDNCNANSSSYSDMPTAYGKNQGGNQQSLAGSKNFLVDEVEVFEVIYKQ